LTNISFLGDIVVSAIVVAIVMAICPCGVMIVVTPMAIMVVVISLVVLMPISTIIVVVVSSILNESRTPTATVEASLVHRLFFLTRENCEATAPQHFIENKGSSICTKKEQGN
jgi:hypothetical protein